VRIKEKSTVYYKRNWDERKGDVTLCRIEVSVGSAEDPGGEQSL